MNPRVCLRGDLLAASEQTLDSLGIGKTGVRRQSVGLSTRNVCRKILISG